MWYFRAFGSYQNVIDRGMLLRRGLLNQWFHWLSWRQHFERFTMNWLIVAEYLCHKCPRICSICLKFFHVLSSFMIYHRVYNGSNTTDANSEAGTATLPGSPDVFMKVHVARSIVLCLFYVDCLSFYFRPLRCMSYLRFLSTPFVSSNFYWCEHVLYAPGISILHKSWLMLIL